MVALSPGHIASPMGYRHFGSKLYGFARQYSRPSRLDRFQFSNDQPKGLRFVAPPAVSFAIEQLNCSLGASAGPRAVAFDH